MRSVNNWNQQEWKFSITANIIALNCFGWENCLPTTNAVSVKHFELNWRGAWRSSDFHSRFTCREDLWGPSPVRRASCQFLAANSSPSPRHISLPVIFLPRSRAKNKSQHEWTAWPVNDVRYRGIPIGFWISYRFYQILLSSWKPSRNYNSMTGTEIEIVASVAAVNWRIRIDVYAARDKLMFHSEPARGTDNIRFIQLFWIGRFISLRTG